MANTDDKQDAVTIKHLVISGGGPNGLVTYGAAKYLAQKGFWNIAQIESIYGCSIGAYFGVVFSLNYEWSWLDDYYVKRPWEKLFKFSGNDVMNMFTEKGLVGEKTIMGGLAPLLLAKDLDVNITLAELYAYNKIDIHMYSVNVNTPTLTKVDISHKTHPNLSVVKALWMTMAFPLLFKPVCLGEDCFVDGGIMNNFPLKDCLDQSADMDPGSILAFKNLYTPSVERVLISNDSSLLDFIMTSITKLTNVLDTEQMQPVISNIVECRVQEGNFNLWIEALATQEARLILVEKGEKIGADFYLNVS
jgi:predicted acylesterase/phospholipase RssA